MKQLLELQIVPAQVEYRRTDAQIEYVNSDAKMKLNINRGEMKIDSRPTKVNVDTYACRASMGSGFQKVGDNISEYASKGNMAAENATAQYAQRGRAMANTQLGEELITQFAKQDTYKNVKMNIGIDFIPRVAPTVNVEAGEITMDFQMDQLDFDWELQDHELKFTPGSISVEVVQRPDVIVRYVGEPNYVPAQA